LYEYIHSKNISIIAEKSGFKKNPDCNPKLEILKGKIS